jgi:ribonuclease HI
MSSEKYYVVYRGVKNGIYKTWGECQVAIKGYPCSIFKKIDNIEDAKYFLENGKLPDKGNKYEKGESVVSIFTDGSTITNKNNIRYGYGVYIPEYNIEISKSLIDDTPTNNRAELTAILVGINIIVSEKSEIKEIHIYTDSKYSIIMLSKKEYPENTLNIDLLDKINKLINDNNLTVTYHKVQAHTDYNDEVSQANKVVDKLAYNGAISQFMVEDEDIGNHKLSFGKYVGTAIRYIPNDYLKWLIQQGKREWVNRHIEADINAVKSYFKMNSTSK